MTTPPTPPTDNLAAEGGPRSEMPSAENDVTPCDHHGDCPPLKGGCRWVQFERLYDHCDCGGWDERYVSRDGGTRVRGRSNHARACVIPPGSTDPEATR